MSDFLFFVVCMVDGIRKVVISLFFILIVGQVL